MTSATRWHMQGQRKQPTTNDTATQAKPDVIMLYAAQEAAGKSPTKRHFIVATANAFIATLAKSPRKTDCPEPSKYFWRDAAASA